MHDLGDLVIFSGPNASGKTNAIEALQLLTALSSFRNPKIAELIMQGKETARISVHITDGKRQLDNVLIINRDPLQGNASKHYVYNGKNRPAKELRGILPSVVFTPDDLNLAKGSNKYRRNELDVLGSQLNANYYQIVRDFDKVLRQKNKLLKEEAALPLLEASDEVFQTVANQFTNYRRALFDRLAPKISKHYEYFDDGKEKLDAIYIEGKNKESASAKPTLYDEIAAHRSLSGPQTHAIDFFINGMAVRDFASQGQQRSLVLAMKLAESELVEEMLQQQPVMLLDDVMSELDGSRREALVKQLLEGKQTFITTANIDYFDPEMLEKARVITF